jgi:hypothetical protein
MKTLLAVTALALTGCATSSGVLPMGGGKYSIMTSASHSAGGAAAAKRNAYTEAAAACSKLNKSAFVVQEAVGNTGIALDGMAHTDLTFECV